MGSEVEGSPISTLESKLMSRISPVLVLRLICAMLSCEQLVLAFFVGRRVLLLCVLRQCILASFVTVVNQVVVVFVSSPLCVACKHCLGGLVGTPQ